jgi:hypothetical protein
MGHAMCGGIQALLNGAPADVSDFVNQWVRIAEPVRARAMAAPAEHRQDICEHDSVRLSLTNLMTFPWIASAISAGTLKLHGCYFGAARRGRQFPPYCRLRISVCLCAKRRAWFNRPRCLNDLFKSGFGWPPPGTRADMIDKV